MNKKLVYLLMILAGCSATAYVYGSGSIVTDTNISTPTVNSATIVNSGSISTNDLTVTGTCTGCGSGGGIGTKTTLINDTTWFSIHAFDIHSTPIVITDTSEPANPQIEYTITSNDANKKPVWGTVNWGGAISMGLKNISGLNDGSISYNYIFTLNGVDVGTDGFDGNNNDYQADSMLQAGSTVDLHTGDKIGLKVWASSSSKFEIDYWGAVLVPSKITPTVNIVSFKPDRTGTPTYDRPLILSFSNQLGLTHQNQNNEPNFFLFRNGNAGEFSSIGAVQFVDLFKQENGTNSNSGFQESAGSNCFCGFSSPFIIDIGLDGFSTINYWN